MTRISRLYLVKEKGKVLFLFPTNRERILETVKADESPDNELYGLNYFKSLGQQALCADVSPVWQNLLEFPFFFLGRLFRRQIDITFQLGRALLMLPEINETDVVLTNTDSIGLPVCFLKRLGLVRPPVVYAVGLFYIQGKLKEAVDDRKQTLFRQFYIWILSAAEHIVYHSPIEKEKLIKLGLYNPAYCTFVAMGSDGNFFRNIKRSDLGVGQGRTLKYSQLILSIGRDHARDYKTLFEAAKKLPDVEFVVICSRRNVEGLKVSKNVKIFFDLSYGEVTDWYGLAAAVVIPMKEMHRSSGQMTLTDAIQAGKAVVASDVVGISHYGLKSERDALLISPGNSDSLRRAIDRMTQDNKLRKRLEEQSQKLAKIFTTENYAKNVSKAVEWAINPVRLRPLEKDDLEFARQLRNENRQHFFDSGYISRQDQSKWYEVYRKKIDDFMFVLENNRERVGIGAIYRIDRVKKSAEIGRFVIHSKFRNRGLGKELMKKVERVAAGEMRLDRLVLEVLRQNYSAVNVYKKMGYAQYGVRKSAGRVVVKMEKVLQSPHAKRE